MLRTKASDQLQKSMEAGMTRRTVNPFCVSIVVLLCVFLMSQNSAAQSGPCDPDPCPGIENAVAGTCAPVGGVCSAAEDFTCDCETEFIWQDDTNTCGVNFSDYFPLTSSTHCVKTLRVTHPVLPDPPEKVMEIGVNEDVHYMEGESPITGTHITNFGIATNDGTTVRLLAHWDEGTRFIYFSTDGQEHDDDGVCKLTEHPATLSFGTIAEGQIKDQRHSYMIETDFTLPCSPTFTQETDTLILFDVQDVTLLMDTPYQTLYENAVIFWVLGTSCFTSLDPILSTDDLIRFSELLPTETDTRFESEDCDPHDPATVGYDVTGMAIFAKGIGLVAEAEIEGDTGEVEYVFEMVERQCPEP